VGVEHGDRGPVLKVFGAALDALPDRRKIAIKHAYMAAAAAQRLPPDDPLDPYDALVPLLRRSPLGPRLQLLGKLPVPAAYVPKPPATHAASVSLDSYRDFFAGTGCADMADTVRDHVATHVLPDAPGVMLGVDHALTGGYLHALAEAAGADDLAVLVLDGHVDAIGADARARMHAAVTGEALDADSLQESFSCQSFLRHLLANGTIPPRQLIIAGIYTEPGPELVSRYGDAAVDFVREYESLRASGVTVLTRDQLRDDPGRLSTALAALPGSASRLYVSLDLDVCASERVPAVRFHDSIGITPEQLLDLADRVADFVAERAIALAGVDVMEIDVHLVDVEPVNRAANETLATAVAFLERLLRATACECR